MPYPDISFNYPPALPFGAGFPSLDSVNSARSLPASLGAVQESPSIYAGSAVLNATIAGTTGVGPVITFNVGGNVSAYTYVAGDTTATIAAGHIVTQLNGVGAIAALVTVSNTGAVLTFTATAAGQSGMVSVLIGATGGATVQATSSNASVTVAGTVGAGPTATITINGTAVLYTYVGGDTTATIAAGHIAAAINANGTVNLLVSATNVVNGVAGPVVYIASKGGTYTILTNPTGGATLTVSYETDFLNPYIAFPLSTFSYPAIASGGLLTLDQGRPQELDAATWSALKVQGLIQ
jgi:hypothetical protein